MLNLAIIEGRIGKDIELKQVGQTVVAKISVATSEKWTDKNTGQKQERTTWHNVEAWGKQAEIISQYFKKGDGIGFQGPIQTDEYEKNGEKRYSNKIKLTSFWFPVSSGQAQNTQPQQVSNPSYGNIPQNTPQFNNNMQGEPKPSTVDDDIPFNALNGQLAHLI